MDYVYHLAGVDIQQDRLIQKPGTGSSKRHIPYPDPVGLGDLEILFPQVGSRWCGSYGSVVFHREAKQRLRWTSILAPYGDH